MSIRFFTHGQNSSQYPESITFTCLHQREIINSRSLQNCTEFKVDCLSDKEMTNSFAIIELLPKSLSGFIRLIEYNIFFRKKAPQKCLTGFIRRSFTRINTLDIMIGNNVDMKLPLWLHLLFVEFSYFVIKLNVSKWMYHDW